MRNNNSNALENDLSYELENNSEGSLMDAEKQSIFNEIALSYLYIGDDNKLYKISSPNDIDLIVKNNLGLVMVQNNVRYIKAGNLNEGTVLKNFIPSGGAVVGDYVVKNGKFLLASQAESLTAGLRAYYSDKTTGSSPLEQIKSLKQVLQEKKITSSLINKIEDGDIKEYSARQLNAINKNLISTLNKGTLKDDLMKFKNSKDVYESKQTFVGGVFRAVGGFFDKGLSVAVKTIEAPGALAQWGLDKVGIKNSFVKQLFSLPLSLTGLGSLKLPFLENRPKLKTGLKIFTFVASIAVLGLAITSTVLTGGLAIPAGVAIAGMAVSGIFLVKGVRSFINEIKEFNLENVVANGKEISKNKTLNQDKSKFSGHTLNFDGIKKENSTSPSLSKNKEISSKIHQNDELFIGGGKNSTIPSLSKNLNIVEQTVDNKIVTEKEISSKIHQNAKLFIGKEKYLIKTEGDKFKCTSSNGEDINFEQLIKLIKDKVVKGKQAIQYVSNDVKEEKATQRYS